MQLIEVPEKQEELRVFKETMRIFQNFLSLQTLDPESPTNMKHTKGKNT